MTSMTWVASLPGQRLSTRSRWDRMRQGQGIDGRPRRTRDFIVLQLDLIVDFMGFYSGFIMVN